MGFNNNFTSVQNEVICSDESISEIFYQTLLIYDFWSRLILSISGRTGSEYFGLDAARNTRCGINDRATSTSDRRERTASQSRRNAPRRANSTSQFRTLSRPRPIAVSTNGPSSRLSPKSELIALFPDSFTRSKTCK